MTSEAPRGTVGEVARYFFRLGVIAFGGPAAHIAIMRRELVRERGWVDDAAFVDLLGATNLIPGPNSTEMTMHLGALRAGRWGLWAGGAAFIVPAVTIVLALAVAYVRWGTTPAAEALLAGIQPFVLAIIVQAIWGLRRAAFKGPIATVVALLAVLLAIAGVNQALLVPGAGLLALAASAGAGGRLQRWPGAFARLARRATAAFGRGSAKAMLPLMAVATPAGYSPWELFWVFLRIGSVLYGSGYVLFGFLNADLVQHRGWLTEGQLVDTIAAGQFTPGPVFSSATFAGYVIDGYRGAALATLGLFLPSFVFVGLTHRWIPVLRRTPWAAPFLDGVNAAAVALMALVTFELARDALDGGFALALFALAAAWLIRWSPNSAWLVLAGAIAGIARALLT
ncbi:MAG: chromate efflux transporter [Dehalococcoidia bacterium]